MMLQQTTVATTIPYYHRFLKRFPTLRNLAQSKLEDVLAVWSGLGYYARARHLHRTANLAVEQYRGEIPGDIEELKKLPGIGRYTAGAIRSLAFGKPAPILDGNVTRVLSRLLAIREDVQKPENQERLWSYAEAFSDCRQARDVNLALFDLGATVCKPKEPLCLLCPLQKFCKARSLGLQEAIPFKAAPAQRKSATWLVPIVRRDDQLLMALRKPTGLFAGLWEFPNIKAIPQKSPIETMEEKLREWGISAKVEKSLPPVSHTLTHREFTMRPFLCHWALNPHPYPLPCQGEGKKGYVRFKWVHTREIDKMAISNLTRKILNSLNSLS